MVCVHGVHVLQSTVPQAGDLLETKNWRPVVILTATSKCLERVLKHQIKQHLERKVVGMCLLDMAAAFNLVLSFTSGDFVSVRSSL